MAILTIARQYGSGGKEIGRKVAALMNYEYIDRAQIFQEMEKAGIDWEKKAEYYDENRPSVWEMYKWSYRGFVALNQSHILNYALRDRVVIMGRGGNFLTRDVPYALRIRLTAPIEKRIENVMQWNDINNTENARLLIEKVDREMAGAVYSIYGSTWDDPENYDLVFDAGRQSQEEIVDILKAELEKKDKLYTDKARTVLELKALAAKIKAAIAINPDLFVSTLDVKLKEEGLVEYGLIVTGAIYNQTDKGKIEETVKGLSGDVPVEFVFHKRMYPRFGELQFK